MRITRLSHACVRLEVDGTVIVIDPGIWSERDALAGADAVLITHEHTDHVDVTLFRTFDGPVFAPAGAAIDQLRYVPVVTGTSFAAAGVDVLPIGGAHAAVVEDQVVCANVGYLVGDVYHPGDSLDLPPRKVDTLLVPMQASWLKTAEAIDYLQHASYRQAIGIHDGQLNDRGIRSVNGWFDHAAGSRYRYLLAGTTASAG